MAAPDTIIIGTKAYSWKALCELRRQQLAKWQRSDLLAYKGLDHGGYSALKVVYAFRDIGIAGNSEVVGERQGGDIIKSVKNDCGDKDRRDRSPNLVRLRHQFYGAVRRGIRAAENGKDLDYIRPGEPIEDSRVICEWLEPVKGESTSDA
jgi:hypothetical protein